MGDLLRLGRVAAAVLRLVGSYRAAAVLGVVLALGWFFAGRADAADYGGYGDAAGPLRFSDPVIEPGTGRLLLAWAGTAVLVWLAVGVAVVVLLCLGGGRLRHRGDAVRHGGDDGGARCDPARLHAAGRVDGGEPRFFVGQP